MLVETLFAEKLKARVVKTEPAGPAEIIIFPGVRFERIDFAAPSHRKSRRLPSLSNQATAEELDQH
jgi:hypothetical protein